LFIIFLCWCCCLNVFMGELHRTSFNELGTILETKYGFAKANTLEYDNTASCNTAASATPSACATCATSGKGTVGIAAIVFIITSYQMAITGIRFAGEAGRCNPIRFCIKSVEASLKAEIVIMAVVCFLLFIQVCIWGNGCYRVELVPQDSKVMTGFGFMVAMFFFSLAAVPMLWLINRNTSLQYSMSGEAPVQQSKPQQQQAPQQQQMQQMPPPQPEQQYDNNAQYGQQQQQYGQNQYGNGAMA